MVVCNCRVVVLFSSSSISLMNSCGVVVDFDDIDDNVPFIISSGFDLYTARALLGVNNLNDSLI